MHSQTLVRVFLLLSFSCMFIQAMRLNQVIPKDELSEISRERQLANKLLHRLLDVAYETFRDYGGTENELKEVQRKRAVITACYFQAVSCY